MKQFSRNRFPPYLQVFESRTLVYPALLQLFSRFSVIFNKCMLKAWMTNRLIIRIVYETPCLYISKAILKKNWENNIKVDMLVDSILLFYTYLR